MALSVRLGGNAGKFQAEAASLNRDALDLQMKIKTADAATLDRSAADLALKAIDFQRQIKVADAARLDQSAAQLAQKAMEFQKQIKVADAATLVGGGPRPCGSGAGGPRREWERAAAGGARVGRVNRDSLRCES